MKTRCTISHATLGEKLIDGPDSIDGLVLSLIRHEDYHSLFENFEGEFWFFGSNGVIDGGLDFILEAERLDGPDVTINITFMIAPNDYVFITVFEGTLAVDGIQKGQDNRALIPVVRNDFSAKFKNRVDQPVNIQSETDQDGNQAEVFDNVQLDMLPQKVPMTFDGQSVGFGSETGDDVIDSFNYFQMSWDRINLEEFDEYFTLPQVGNVDQPVEVFIVEYAGSYRFQMQTVGQLTAFSFPTPGLTRVSDYFWPYLNIDGVEIPFDLLPFPIPGIDEFDIWSIDTTQDLSAKSAVKVYFKTLVKLGFSGTYTGSFRWNGYLNIPDVVFPNRFIFPSTAVINAQTVYPATPGDGFLVHDVAGMILDRTIGRGDTFYSELLGSDRTVYRQYDADGCGWENMLLRGLQIRQYELIDKPFFISFKDWWDGINPILCLGLGYETIDGTEVMRAEGREYFYDPTPSLYIDNVTFTRRYDESVMIKTFRNGYKKWQSENISGIDDPQTKHTRASRLQKSGTDLVMESGFIAASLAIETTRRTTRKKSADYKYDDDVFIVSVTSIGTSPASFYEPKTDEGFSSVTNLQNPETRYNLLLTPARNFIRWSKWLFGGLQNYVGSIFKFTGGEGNYDMSSEYAASDGCDEYSEPLSEKQDFEVTDEYLHRGEVYPFSGQLELEQYLIIKENRNKAVAMSQTTTDHKIFFIKNLSYKAFESTVTGEVWALEFFDPEVVEEGGLDQVCYPHADSCVDALLTELGLELITEDSECLVLE